jgi:hypothetical protein
MSLPFAANVRFAIYRDSAPPPSAPAAADVPGYLDGAYDDGLERAEAANELRYTHRLLVDESVDVRDDFQSFTVTGQRDLIYVPDAAGTPFEVVFVERPFRGFGLAVKRVFLNRRSPNWPTNDL